MTLEEEIEDLKTRADSYQRINLRTLSEECRTVAEWLEELRELRKRSND